MRLSRVIALFVSVPVMLIVLVYAAWLFTSASARAHVLVMNESGVPLSNVSISGACEKRGADILAAHSEWRSVTPYCATGSIRISFQGAGNTYAAVADVDTNHAGVCGITF